VAVAPAARCRPGRGHQSDDADAASTTTPAGDPSRRRRALQLPADPHAGLPAALAGTDALRPRARLRAGRLLVTQVRERVHDHVPKLQQRADLIL